MYPAVHAPRAKAKILKTAFPFFFTGPLKGMAGLCLAALAAAAVQAATVPASGYSPNEAQANQRVDLLDSEFSQSRNMFTWCDYQGHLWVGKVDPATGNITNPTYKLIDSDAITPSEMSITTNGPEWVSTATGDHIVYTKFLAGQTPSAKTARLAYAQLNTDGSVNSVTVLGPDLPRNAPYASDDEGDANPRISYVDQYNRHYWRYLNDDTSETKVKGMQATPKPVSVRFVRGANALVYSQDVNGVKQVFMLKLDSGKLTQITTDDGDKDLRTVPWMWSAPEFNGKQVLMTTVNETELRFYRLMDKDGDGVSTWTLFNTITMPAGSTVASPEPFTYNGKSYVSLALTQTAIGYPSSIWLGTVNPKNAAFWKVSDDSSPRVRMDPEVYITDNGPVVFYNRFDPSKATGDQPPWCSACSEGLFRSTSGILPSN